MDPTQLNKLSLGFFCFLYKYSQANHSYGIFFLFQVVAFKLKQAFVIYLKKNAADHLIV